MTMSAIDKSDKNWRRCCRSPLLFSRINKSLSRLNDDFWDSSLIDTSLEYKEALADIKRRHPWVQIHDVEDEIPS